VVETHAARVFRTQRGFRGRGGTYGCHRRVGKLVDLERVPGVLGTEFPERPFVLAGRYVAYQMEATNPDIQNETQNIFVVDLRRGRTKYRVYDIFDRHPPRPPARHAVLENLVLRRSGSAAWLSRGPDDNGDETREIYRVDPHGVRRLDQGIEIERASLRLRDGRLYWWKAGLRRTATLR
jgi:hypothetical protein